MENQVAIKCPKCGSQNVVIQKRGYSFLQGFLIGVVFVFLDLIYSVFINASDYQAMDEFGKTGFAAGLLLKLVLIFILGLVLGTIGKNKLIARCLKCKNKFDPSVGIKE